MGFFTYLNDISILDDCSQQFAVFRLILLLLQVSSMLTGAITQNTMQSFTSVTFANRFSTQHYSIWCMHFWKKKKTTVILHGVCWGGLCQWCCCRQALLPSRTVSVPSICSWDIVWKGSLGKRNKERKRSNNHTSSFALANTCMISPMAKFECATLRLHVVYILCDSVWLNKVKWDKTQVKLK